MSELLQIAFDMWRPYFSADFGYSRRPASDLPKLWANLVKNANSDLAAFGDIESIDVKDFDFLSFCGRRRYPPICIFNPWRSGLGFYESERDEFYKNHPEEPERLRALLRKAEALLAAKKTAAAAPVAKLATA